MLSSSIFGCTSPDQVDALVGAALNPVPFEIMDEFYDVYMEHVQCLVPEQHFYWFKTQQPHNVEWAEMAAYPRQLWTDALNSTNVVKA